LQLVLDYLFGMSHADEISLLLESENSFTTKWLSNALRIDISAARVALQEYQAATSDVSLSYLVVGTTSTGALSFLVAEDSKLSDVRSTLQSVRSEEIYAIHKVKSITNKIELQAAEYEQASELLMMSHPNSENFFKNKNGYISCPTIDVKPVGQRILASTSLAGQSVSTNAPAIQGSVTKALSQKAQPTAAPAAPLAAPAVLKSKSSISVGNFFSKAAATSSSSTSTSTSAAATDKKAVAEVKDVKPTVAAPVLKEESDEPVKRKGGGKIQIDDDEEEFDSEYKPDANRLKERAAAANASLLGIKTGAVAPEEEEEGEEEKGEETKKKKKGSSAKETDLVDTAEEGAGQSKKRKETVVRRGAMDDYMEDIAIAEYNNANATDETGAKVPVPKSKKRKLVEKV
jgi:hypothetical protein